MRKVLWTGRLSLPMKLMVNTSNLLAWLDGNARNGGAMKQRVKLGYDATFTNDVTRYDKMGLDFQIKAGRAQLDGLDINGKTVLDVGAGTGALSFLLLENGAARVTCGDISGFMLSQCREKARAKGYREDRIDFRLLDAESLPFGDNSFDIAVTGMTLGLLPNQEGAIREMARVVKPGGYISVGAHGPEHYWEPTDAYFRAITKRYVLGYRLEFWPRTEREVRDMMTKAGLSDVVTKREIWRNRFASGGEAFDFFTAISASWWYARFPADKRRSDYERVRAYFVSKNKNVVTDDIVLAGGRKPPTATSSIT